MKIAPTLSKKFLKCLLPSLVLATFSWASPAQAIDWQQLFERVRYKAYSAPYQTKGTQNRSVNQLYRKMMRDPNPTMNYPYFWAWKTFIEVNRPISKSRWYRKASSTPRWETWASDVETFPKCPDADVPPVWPGKINRAKILSPQRQIQTEDFVSSLTWYVLEDGVPTGVEVTDPQEVKRNKASFDYIADNGFYYTEGLVTAFQEVQSAVDDANGSTARSMAAVQNVIKFPVGSVEMKMDWIPIENIPENERDDYYRTFAVVVNEDGIESGPAEYALATMHISTKDIPDWFWATWMNKNVLGRCDDIGCTDEFGMTPAYTEPHDETNYPYPGGELNDQLKAMMQMAGLDEVLQNYRLVGIQTNFVDPTGQPVLNSNTITEQGYLKTGSCMSCHSRAAFDSTGTHISGHSAASAAETPLPGESLVTDNGAPDPDWFWSSVNGVDENGDTVDYFSSSTEITGLTAVQLDFVWGFIFANSVTACE